MDLIENIVLGVVQGLTEFLPVSSSGHLFLTEYAFGYQPNLVLEVWFHLASLLAVVVFFRKEIGALIVEFIKNPLPKLNEDKPQLPHKLILTTLFTFPIAYTLNKLIDQNLTLNIVAFSLIITALLIGASEKFRGKNVRKFSWKIAILLGLIQGFAVMPGISRSGLTIAFLILLGLQRKESAEISFLLSIPTILGAVIFSINDLPSEILTTNFAIGATICFLASLASIKWMMKIIEGKWIYFAPYCAILGLILLVF